jgi:uridine kinase
VDPFRDGAQAGAGTGFQLTAFDLVRDARVESQWVTAPRDAVLVVDGVFLHRAELRDLWDWSVWLEVPWPVAYARMALRDGSDPDPEAPSNSRYRQGQEIYLREARPSEVASAIVDNADLAHPRRVFRGVR